MPSLIFDRKIHTKFKEPFSVFFLKQRAVKEKYSGLVPDTDDIKTVLVFQQITSITDLARLAQRIKSDREIFFSCSVSADKKGWDQYFSASRYKSPPTLTVELQALGAIARQAGLAEGSHNSKDLPVESVEFDTENENKKLPWYKRIKLYSKRRGDKGYDIGIGPRFTW